MYEAKPQPTSDLVHIGIKNFNSGGTAVFVDFPEEKERKCS